MTMPNLNVNASEDFTPGLPAPTLKTFTCIVLAINFFGPDRNGNPAKNAKLMLKLIKQDGSTVPNPVLVERSLPVAKVLELQAAGLAPSAQITLRAMGVNAASARALPATEKNEAATIYSLIGFVPGSLEVVRGVLAMNLELTAEAPVQPEAPARAQTLSSQPAKPSPAMLDLDAVANAPVTGEKKPGLLNRVGSFLAKL